MTKLFSKINKRKKFHIFTFIYMLITGLILFYSTQIFVGLMGSIVLAIIGAQLVGIARNIISDWRNE